MNSFSSLFLILAADDQAAPPGGMGQMLVPMILIFVMMYFLLIRPQKKRQQEMQAQMAALKTGDKVITAGGIHGLITNVKEKSVTVKVAESVKLEFEKASIVTVIRKDGSETSSAAHPLEASASQSSQSSQ